MNQQKRNSVDVLITAVIVAAGHLAECKQREMELESSRGQVKAEAIARIMSNPDPMRNNKQYSATAAAEVATYDTVFALHEQDRREATAKTIRAMGEYAAAKLRATFAIIVETHLEGDDEPLDMGLGTDHTATVVRT